MAPAATDLCTVADVKLYANINGSASDDLIQSIITSQSVRIARYCERDFTGGAKTYTDTYNGTGTSRLPLRHWPLMGVTSVSIYGVTIPQSVDQSAGWVASIWDGSSLPIPAAWIGLSGGGAWPSPGGSLASITGIFNPGNQNVVVTYSAGFAAVPVDVKDACIMLVIQVMKERERIGQRSVTMAQQTMSYVLDMLPMVRETLDFYRRKTPPLP